MFRIRFLLAMMLFPAAGFAQSWNPTPLVIDCPQVIQYNFDGRNIDIPYTLTGKPAMVWLVINTKLNDSQKPVAVRNGFMGWHFVNGIDTTVYVSTGRQYDIGMNHTFPWDGHGSEREYDRTVDSGMAEPISNGCDKAFSYYLFAIDNQSAREMVNDFIPIGYYSHPQYARFYFQDDQTGAILPHPLLMGGIVTNIGTSPRLSANTLFKFRLGDNPYDDTLIQTSQMNLHADETPGTGIYLTSDYDQYYMLKNRQADNSLTVTKYRFISGGEAVQDTSWGDFSQVTWFTSNSTEESVQAMLQADHDNFYVADGGYQLLSAPSDVIRGFPQERPVDIQFDLALDEFFAPQPGPGLYPGKLNRFEPGLSNGQFYVSGEISCLTELVNCHRLMDGATQSFAPDGSGYVVWANSNGDFFTDRNTYPDPRYPNQLWACHTNTPGSFNTMRSAPSPADHNGFMVSHLEYAGLYMCAMYTPDGSGIDMLRNPNDCFCSYDYVPHGNGTALDYGGQYDGIYVNDYDYPGTPAIPKTTWFGCDSDGGFIGTFGDLCGWDGIQSVPADFSLSQNSPNPFNPYTTIMFTLPEKAPVTLNIYNVAGQKLDTLLNGTMTAGAHSVIWDGGKNPAGVYFYTIQSGEFTKTMKMTLLKYSLTPVIPPLGDSLVRHAWQT